MTDKVKAALAVSRPGALRQYWQRFGCCGIKASVDTPPCKRSG
jgi:hypothetical protein